MQTGASTQEKLSSPAIEVETPAARRSSQVAHTQPSPGKSNREGGRSRAGAHSPTLHSAPVTANELQGAVLFVLGLYASIAVLNLHSEFSTLVHHWQSFVEFLANRMF